MRGKTFLKRGKKNTHMPPTHTRNPGLSGSYSLLKNASIPRSFGKRFGISGQEGGRPFVYVDIVIKDKGIYKIYEKGGGDGDGGGVGGYRAKEPSRFSTIIDLKGRTVCPGFVDTHTHLSHFSNTFLSAELSGCRSKQEAIAKTRTFLEEQETPLSFLVALNFDESQWDEKRYPEKRELDTISKDIPVILVRVCGHMAVLNSVAMDMARGKIETQQRNGELSPDELKELLAFTDNEKGHVREKAMWHLLELFSHSEEDKIEALEKAVRHFTVQGVTGIHDIFPLETLELYNHFFRRDIVNARTFPLNIQGYLIITVSQNGFDETVAEGQWSKAQGILKNITTTLREKSMDSRFRLEGIKLFLDGSLGARTAALLEEYADSPGTRGDVLLTQNELKKAFGFCLGHDIELMAHVIGDRALTETITTIEEFTRNPIPLSQREGPLKVRLEHVEVLPDSLLERMRNLDNKKVKLTLSMMPNFAGNWSKLPDGMNMVRLGDERYKICERFKSVYGSGIPLLFGSDCMPPDPLYGICSAVQSPNEDERLTLPEAIECYTGGIPFSHEQKDANLVLLSHDMNTIKDEDELKKVKVVATIFKGAVVWMREKERLFSGAGL